ncbi:MAG: tetratricopeptide repeat protein [Gemmatimonadetes bacterium]|nr:tetratricopeptide repeat protein [Gemmatimonadota bacterium]
MKTIILGILCIALTATDGLAKDASPEAIAAAERAYQEGMKHFEAENLDAALVSFRSAIAQHEKYAPAYVGLGHVYLKQGNLAEAEKAFKTAVSKNKKYAPAYNGLGLVYSRKKNELRRAITYFRDANRADKKYSEAQYNLAQTLENYGSSETLKAYRNVLKIDPKHPNANYRIGILLDKDGEREKAVQAYRDQLEAKSDHLGARLNLGIDLKLLGQLREALQHLLKVATVASDFQRRAVLELAQVFQRAKAFEQSARLFESYIKQLPEKEQETYCDLNLLTSGPILKEYNDAETLPQKKRVFRTFWSRLDPAPVTEANERLLEHYRRVAYAREFFGTLRFPWDARGEAYIRYGAPDHVSNSGNIQLERTKKLVDVKERLIQKAGPAVDRLLRARADAVASSMVGMRGQLQRTGDRSPGARGERQQVTSGTILGWPVYPVDGIWEYWIYADVGDGIEVVFEQRSNQGAWDYADIPLGRGRIARIWQDMHPEIVLKQVAAITPMTYRPDFATGALDFYLASSAFRGQEDLTALEIYYGIPTAQLHFAAGQDGARIAQLDRGIVVYNQAGDPVYRTSREMVLGASGEADQSPGAYMPEMDRLFLTPGNYRISVQVLDRRSRKSQVYHINRVVPEYDIDDELKISDVELAATINVADKSRFQKGGIEVIPIASRAYLPTQPVFIYFEIYNLKRNAFGQTKYRVSYVVRSRDQKTIGARILGGVGKMLGQKSEQGVISIEYEQVGTETQEPGYLELDMSRSEPGEKIVEIAIVDETTGQTATATATFVTQ